MEIRNMKHTPCLNITIDNCDIADGVNEERMGDHGIHTSATTGLVNRGIEMPEDGLSQDMLNRQYRVKTPDIVLAGTAHKLLPKVFNPPSRFRKIQAFYRISVRTYKLIN